MSTQCNSTLVCRSTKSTVGEFWNCSLVQLCLLFSKQISWWDDDKHLVCLPWCRQALGVCLCGAGMLVMHGVIWVTKEQFGLWKARQATGITSMCTAGVWIRVPLIMKLVMCCNMQALHSYLFQSLLKLKGLIFSGRTEERTWINSQVIMRLFWSSGMGAIIALP